VQQSAGLYFGVVGQMMTRLLTLFAVLLLPLAMAPGASAAPAEAHAAMPMEHCPEQAPDHHSKAGFAQCTMACSAALPVAFAPGEQRFVIVCAPSERAAAQMLSGIHPETATPPPKRS
jgi:hypothetical protein